MSQLSAPGSVLIAYEVTSRGVMVLWYTQTVFLSKQILLIVAGRQRDAQTIEVPEALHF